MKVKISYRIISAVLVFVMVFTILPLNAFAMETEVEDEGFTSVQIPIENDNVETGNEPDSIIDPDDQYNNSLSFVGWMILCVFTFGIGFIWLIPYMKTTTTAFYQEAYESYKQNA